MSYLQPAAQRSEASGSCRAVRQDAIRPVDIDQAPTIALNNTSQCQRAIKGVLWNACVSQKQAQHQVKKKSSAWQLLEDGDADLATLRNPSSKDGRGSKRQHGKDAPAICSKWRCQAMAQSIHKMARSLHVHMEAQPGVPCGWQCRNAYGVCKMINDPDSPY